MKRLHRTLNLMLLDLLFFFMRAATIVSIIGIVEHTTNPDFFSNGACAYPRPKQVISR